MSLPETDCTQCGAPVGIPEDVQIGEMITCEECGMNLEVVDVDDEHHITLELVPEDEEEWEE